MKVPDLFVGKRLFLGLGNPEALGRGKKEVRGSAFLEGPVQAGTADAFDEIEATVMIGRDKNDDKDSNPDRSLHVKGNQRLEGDSGSSSTLKITSVTGRAVDINSGTVWIDDAGEAMFQKGTDGMTLSARFDDADGRPKPFDLEHPTKGKGHRLRYACIEGPEVGVYYRGRLKDSDTIELPYYWKDLVHADSITVQLQPIGDRHYHLNVVEFDNEKIIVSEPDGKPIDCFYHVYGERKDINPLITEYEGNDCDDYPDPNHHRVPYPQRNYNDPEYRGPRNTITS